MSMYPNQEELEQLQREQMRRELIFPFLALVFFALSFVGVLIGARLILKHSGQLTAPQQQRDGKEGYGSAGNRSR